MRLPVGERQAILLPDDALSRHGGLDFVTVEAGGARVERVVVPGGLVRLEGEAWREILTGLSVGDQVVVGNE